MILVKWEDLPDNMKSEKVRKYYDILCKKKGALLLKRVFDIVAALIMLIILSPVFLVLAVLIKIDSLGPVFYRQERVTQYGKRFRIHKFRTMVQNADKGSQVTIKNDSRVTRVGKFIRKCRLDEIPQLVDILAGDLTLVGTRPESPHYVSAYTDEMMATLLLPAGVTSLASILFRDEADLLNGVKNVDEIYIEEVLPRKMHYNLRAISDFSIFGEISILLQTVLIMFGIRIEMKPSNPHGEVYVQNSKDQEN